MPRPRLSLAKSTLAVLATVLVSIPVSATVIVFDPEGEAGFGMNDSVASATETGIGPATMPAVIFGSISKADINDVDFYRLVINAASGPVFFDIDLSDDPGASEDLDAGLDAALWIFDGAGRLVSFNDDSDFFGLEIDNEGSDPGSDDVADRDPFVGSLPLLPGEYFVAVAWFGKHPIAMSQSGLTFSSLVPSGIGVMGALSESTFESASCGEVAESCAGNYRLEIRETFVPEPNFAFALPLGILMLAILARRDPPKTGRLRSLRPKFPGPGRICLIRSVVVRTRLTGGAEKGPSFFYSR